MTTTFVQITPEEITAALATTEYPASPEWLKPLEEGEQVVGEIPHPARALFALSYAKRTEAKALREETGYNAEVCAYMHLDESVTDLAWNLTRQAHPEATHHKSIGVRAGWQLVALEEEEEDEPSDLLSRLFGGGSVGVMIVGGSTRRM